MDLDLATMMVANLRYGNPNQILKIGGLAQLVERLLCKQEVSGSNPLSSTKLMNSKKGGAA
jgi:hypothetical protein|tara:strand:+ start:52 stop:234 length:183 start_codon:yes stop_codon:yes gene_type:complete